jgi:hypothetical protein
MPRLRPPSQLGPAASVGLVLSSCAGGKRRGEGDLVAMLPTGVEEQIPLAGGCRQLDQRWEHAGSLERAWRPALLRPLDGGVERLGITPKSMEQDHEDIARERAGLERIGGGSRPPEEGDGGVGLDAKLGRKEVS